MIKPLKIRKGSGLLVGGCYVVFSEMLVSADGASAVLRVRGDLGEFFSGCVCSVGVLGNGRVSFVEFGGVVSVISV